MKCYFRNIMFSVLYVSFYNKKCNDRMSYFEYRVSHFYQKYIYYINFDFKLTCIFTIYVYGALTYIQKTN